MLDDTAAQIVLSVEIGDSIRRIAHRLQTPYETVRQAVNRLEAAGYLQYDDGLYITDQRFLEAARKLCIMVIMNKPPTLDHIPKVFICDVSSSFER